MESDPFSACVESRTVASSTFTAAWNTSSIHLQVLARRKYLDHSLSVEFFHKFRCQVQSYSFANFVHLIKAEDNDFARTADVPFSVILQRTRHPV